MMVIVMFVLLVCGVGLGFMFGMMHGRAQERARHLDAAEREEYEAKIASLQNQIIQLDRGGATWERKFEREIDREIARKESQDGSI